MNQELQAAAIEGLNSLLVNWNNGTPPSDGGAIPEPASLGLILVGMGALLRRAE